MTFLAVTMAAKTTLCGRTTSHVPAPTPAQPPALLPPLVPAPKGTIPVTNADKVLIGDYDADGRDDSRSTL